MLTSLLKITVIVRMLKIMVSEGGANPKVEL
jgi:hypothetical protein